MPDHTPSRFALLFTALAIAALAGCSRTSVETPGTSKAAAAPEKEVGTVTLKHETLALSTELPGRTMAPVIAEIHHAELRSHKWAQPYLALVTAK